MFLPPLWSSGQRTSRMDATATHSAALVGTLVAPFLFEIISGRVIAVGGVLALLGLLIAAPILGGEWRRLTASSAATLEPADDGSLYRG